MDGISFTLVIGKWAGIGICKDAGFRLILGWVSIGVMFCDIERLMGEILKWLPEAAREDEAK